MDTPVERERAPQFTQPVRQIIVMLIILGLVVFGGYLAYPAVAPVFLSSPYLNGVILTVFVVGVLACYWQVLQLISSVSFRSFSFHNLHFLQRGLRNCYMSRALLYTSKILIAPGLCRVFPVNSKISRISSNLNLSCSTFLSTSGRRRADCSKRYKWGEVWWGPI